MRTFSQIFRALREERGLTQEQLANDLHVTKQAVSHWERGTREPKNRDGYDMIADYFNVDLNYLMGREAQTTQLLNDEELYLVTSYRCADDLERSMVIRILHMEH